MVVAPKGVGSKVIRVLEEILGGQITNVMVEVNE
jgi:hypothetical protein